MSSASTISAWTRCRARPCWRWISSTTRRRQKLVEALGGEPDVVLSDMAAPTTGHRRTDHIRTMHLAKSPPILRISVLKPGGHFLAKTFQGGTENELLDLLKRNFRSVHHVKPPASRDESVELYLLAKDFKGREPRRASERPVVEAAERRIAIAETLAIAPFPSELTGSSTLGVVSRP